MTQKRASNEIFSNLRMIGVGGEFESNWSEEGRVVGTERT
jgi:hypothetical protein